VAIVVVFLLVTGETALFLGLVTPGELVASRNVAGVIEEIERLRLNHVPQKTPTTSEYRNTLTNRAIFMTEARSGHAGPGP
jgi:hypothetical protein